MKQPGEPNQRRFHVTGSALPRPASRHTIYCDGGHDDAFRPGVDIELSHWIPNRTPPVYRADTSTEICLNFAAAAADDRPHFDLVINNHVDVDGILSLFVLVHEELALEHRATLVQAAEIGDFWGWGDHSAQVLFQALTLYRNRLQAAGEDPQEVYARCFERARDVLAGGAHPEVDDGLAALAEALSLIDSGRVARALINQRFVHYAVPWRVARRNVARCLEVPAFNAPLTRTCLLPPQARARLDAERIALVSVETRDGWYYDLWYPGYVWADTPHRWRAPGLVNAGDSNVHGFDQRLLREAARDLGDRETAAGQWAVAGELSPFRSLPGRNFPIVLSFLAGAQPALSAQPPEIVAERLSEAISWSEPN